MIYKSGFTKRKNRKRNIEASNNFSTPRFCIEENEAISIVQHAIKKYEPKTKQNAESIFQKLTKLFPDEYSSDPTNEESWWDSASNLASKDFFVWGHDHDFGFGINRKGSMSTRHIEITSESLSLGFLPTSLSNKKVLNIGPWTGGELLVLSGLGALEIISLEEHTTAANATRTLMEELGILSTVLNLSLFKEKTEWRQYFDYIYCSGVLYHVTDPLLFLRIIFCYLKPEGEILIETKSIPGNNALCGYSGVQEKGWNWYAPDELTLGRWFVDAGFKPRDITIYRRSNGRLLGHAVKKSAAKMIETQGFSRPGSWLIDKH